MTGNQVGTAAGDRLIAEAEADPEFKGFNEDNQVDSDMDEQEQIRRKTRAVEGAIGMVQRGATKADKMINNAEKVMGLRIKSLVDYSNSDEEEEKMANP